MSSWSDSVANDSKYLPITPDAPVALSGVTLSGLFFLIRVISWLVGIILSILRFFPSLCSILVFSSGVRVGLFGFRPFYALVYSFPLLGFCRLVFVLVPWGVSVFVYCLVCRFMGLSICFLVLLWVCLVS